ncbi:MAG: hypothetical protein ACREB9_07925, partial [Thermoplasmata archaeon]
DRPWRRRDVERALHADGDLREEVLDGASRDPHSEVSSDRLGGLSAGRANGQLSRRHSQFGGVATFPESERRQEGGESLSSLAVSNSLDSKVDPHHFG